jgi:hypothetical protein
MGPISCRQIFQRSEYQGTVEKSALAQFMAFTSSLDDTRIRRHVYGFLKKNGKKSPEYVDGTDHLGRPIRVPLQPSLQPMYNPVRILNRMTMGLYGDIFDFQWSPEKKKVVLVRNEKRIAEIREQTAKKLAAVKDVDLTPIRTLISNTIPIQYLNGQMVLVQASLVSFSHRQGFEQAVFHRYQQMGIKTVDFVYRHSGLEAKRPLTGATLMDEIVSILKQGRGYNIHLAFDPKVWELELQLLAGYYQRYQAAQTAQEKAKIIGEMNQGLDPFQPFSGVVTTEFILPTDRPTEIKRYFKNDFEDPIEFLALPAKPEYELRLQMLSQVIGGLRPENELEIHAHSVVHLRAYLKLGFHIFSEMENPLYPGVKVYVLRGEKSGVLEKIKKALDRLQESD